MYYSSIGILAIIILFINNFNILIRSSTKSLSHSHKAYKTFLIGVTIFYIADIIWAPLYELKIGYLTFTETSLFFVAMALSVLFWTKYVIKYLDEKNKITFFLKFTGWIFLFLQITVLIINLFVPIAFWFDEEGEYHTEIARNLNLFFQLIMFLIVATAMLQVVFTSEGNTKRRHYAISLFCLTMTVFIALQIHYPFMPFYSAGYMIGTCMLHTFVLEDEKDASHKKLESLLQLEKLQEFELGTTRKMAYSDPLTGVKNKMAYIEDIGSIEQRIKDKFLSNFGVIVFDLNDLKKINDTHGHDAGDQYIKSASSLICHKFKHSPVYRIGGDEFVTFLSGEDFEKRDELLIDFHNQIEQNLSSGEVVISFGFAEFDPKKDADFLQLFERADKKMYECKQDLKSRKR